MGGPLQSHAAGAIGRKCLTARGIALVLLLFGALQAPAQDKQPATRTPEQRAQLKTADSLKAEMVAHCPFGKKLYYHDCSYAFRGYYHFGLDHDQTNRG